MKGHVGSFVLGLGLAAAGAFLYDAIQDGRLGRELKDASDDLARGASRVIDRAADMVAAGAVAIVDINQASVEDFERIGVHDRDMVDRIVEGRPYRNKMDLLTRMIVPQDIYDVIKYHIDIERPNESVKVA